jgi:hypothetical protein
MSAPVEPLPFLPELMQFVSAINADGTSHQRREKTARECLEALLGIVECLLRAAPRHWSVRQLLLQLLHRVPVKDYLQESLDDGIRNVKEAGPLQLRCKGGRKYDIMDQTCNWLGDEVAHARFIFSESGLAGLLKEIASLPAEDLDGEAQDGPVAEGVFCWKDKEYAFSLLEWRLLKALWGVQRAEEETVRQMVYRGKKGTQNALWALQKRTQDKLAAYRLPFTIRRPRPLYLQLQERSLTKT